MSSSEQERFAASQARVALLELRAGRIRALNDQFRQSFAGGLLTITAGVQALGCEAVADLLDQVRGYAAFTPDNDPYEEHDFGSIDGPWRRVFWKIDYYDPSMEAGAADPSNPDLTTRVLTVMLASEY